jgi:ribonuclease VapC
MVIDPSALLAILQDEPERRAFNELIEAAGEQRQSTASLVELSIVAEARLGAEGIRDLNLFLATAGIELVAFDAVQARLAREGFRRFGKGRHPAAEKPGTDHGFLLLHWEKPGTETGDRQKPGTDHGFLLLHSQGGNRGRTTEYSNACLRCCVRRGRAKSGTRAK